MITLIFKDLWWKFLNRVDWELTLLFSVIQNNVTARNLLAKSGYQCLQITGLEDPTSVIKLILTVRIVITHKVEHKLVYKTTEQMIAEKNTRLKGWTLLVRQSHKTTDNCSLLSFAATGGITAVLLFDNSNVQT